METKENRITIIDESAIEKIYVNGKKAQEYYNKYVLDKTKISFCCYQPGGFKLF